MSRQVINLVTRLSKYLSSEWVSKISRLIIWICLSNHFQNSSTSINDIFQFVEMSSNISRDVSSYFQWHELIVSAMWLSVQIQLNDSLICQKMSISIHRQRYDQTYVRKSKIIFVTWQIWNRLQFSHIVRLSATDLLQSQNDDQYIRFPKCNSCNVSSRPIQYINTFW